MLKTNEPLSELKLKPSTYAPLSYKLRKLRSAELRASLKRKEKEMRAILYEIQSIKSGERDSELLCGEKLPDAEMSDEEYKQKLLQIVVKLSQQKWLSTVLRGAANSEIATRAIDLDSINQNIADDTIRTCVDLKKELLYLCQNAVYASLGESEIQQACTKMRDFIHYEIEAVFGPPIPLPEGQMSTRAKSRDSK